MIRRWCPLCFRWTRQRMGMWSRTQDQTPRTKAQTCQILEGSRPCSPQSNGSLEVHQHQNHRRDQLPFLTAVTDAQRHSLPLSKWDLCEASCIIFTCRPVFLLPRGRRGARRQWRGLTSPPMATPYHARRIEKMHRLAPHHVGVEAWFHQQSPLVWGDTVCR